MKLVEFSIADDFITIKRGSDRFDLHNDFDFEGFWYHPAQRALELCWRRGPGEGTEPTAPSGLSICLSGVYLFKARERDSDMPFTEDDCLDSIGFLWDDLLDEMAGFTSNQPQEGCTHLVATFMSGFCIKVGAESAVLRIPGDA